MAEDAQDSVMFLASIFAQSFRDFVQFAHQLPIGRCIGEEQTLADVPIPRPTPSLKMDLVLRPEFALTVPTHAAFQDTRLVQNASFGRVRLRKEGKSMGSSVVSFINNRNIQTMTRMINSKLSKFLS